MKNDRDDDDKDDDEEEEDNEDNDIILCSNKMISIHIIIDIIILHV